MGQHSMAMVRRSQLEVVPVDVVCSQGAYRSVGRGMERRAGWHRQRKRWQRCGCGRKATGVLPGLQNLSGADETSRVGSIPTCPRQREYADETGGMEGWA